MFECISTLEKVRRDMDDNIYNFTKDGECTGCGSCCSNLIPMNGKEIKEIRRYIRKHDIKECAPSNFVPATEVLIKSKSAVCSE